MTTPLHQNAQVHLPHDEREVVLRVNFSERDHEGRLHASLRFMRGPRHPQAGEWVYLLDSEGCGCLGKVESVRGWAARILPHWDSYASPDGRAHPAEAL